MTVLHTTLRWLFERCCGTLMSGILPPDLAACVPVQVVLVSLLLFTDVILLDLTSTTVGRKRDFFMRLRVEKGSYIKLEEILEMVFSDTDLL